MAQIFIVSSGFYSDYGIEAVFSTREKAEEYIRLRREAGSSMSGADIEEWPLDAYDGHIVRRVYECTIETVTGNVRNQNSRLTTADPHARSDKLEDHENNINTCRGRSFESAEHARKLAAENRQALLRNAITRT